MNSLTIKEIDERGRINGVTWKPYKIYRSGNKHKNHQTITEKVVNGVRQYRLRLRAFVSVGEAFLFLFKASKIHHKSAK